MMVTPARPQRARKCTTGFRLFSIACSFLLVQSHALSATETAATLVDAHGVEFRSLEALCRYHCSAGHFRNDVADCAVDKCSHQRRRLVDQQKQKPIHVISLITCQDDAKANVSFQVAQNAEPNQFPKIFEHFQQHLLQAFDSMITSENATMNACQLQLLQHQLAPADDASTATSPTDHDHAVMFPMLFKLHSGANHDQRDCMQQLRTISNQTFTPLISRSDSSFASSTIVLVHATKAIANQINDLDCIESVTQLPAILKLMPFARSASRLADQETQETPRMEIALVKSSNRSQVFESLSQQFESLTGIVNAFELPSSEQDRRENVVFFRSLHDMETWAKAVSLAITNDQVEWVDRYLPLSLHVLRDTMSLTMDKRLMHQSERRLDQYAEDLIGVQVAKSHGINGNGVVVGITDSGLYIDHDQFDQPERNIYGINTINLSARKVVLYRDWGNRYDESEDVVCGHGTHVSGLLAGSSYTGGAPLGIAANAKIAFMDIGVQKPSCQGEPKCGVELATPGEASELLQSQINAGAKIFSFSWGTPGSDYSVQARELDQFLFENPGVLVIVAAGNSGESNGNGQSTISSPSGAKNVISVGASLNSAKSFTDFQCPRLFNELTVASFSSAGPTSDGRMKPDVVAPGMTLVSAQSLKPGSTDKTSSTCTLQGTSQATPVVAGMAVLLYEWLRDGWWKNGVKDDSYAMKNIPASLLKALIIHSSQGLQRRMAPMPQGLTSCGTLENQAWPLHYPDMYQGYGKPNMSTVADFSTRGASTNGTDREQALYFLPNSTEGSEPAVEEGKEVIIYFLVRKGVDLRATLVWTDPAGSIRSSSMLQHDLDLTVRIHNGSTVFRPLTADNATGRDEKNNVEMVQVSYDELVQAAHADQPQTNGLNTSLIGASGEIVVEARVFGRSVKLSQSQPFAFVASSSTIGTASGFAKTNVNKTSWSTGFIVAALAGGLATLVVIALLIHCCCRRKWSSDNSQRHGAYGMNSTPAERNHHNRDHQHQSEQEATAAAIAASMIAVTETQCPFCHFSTSDAVLMVNHVEMLHPNANDSVATTSIPIVMPASAPVVPAASMSQTANAIANYDDPRCPFCNFAALDPVILVNHVEAFHPQGGVS